MSTISSMSRLKVSSASVTNSGMRKLSSSPHLLGICEETEDGSEVFQSTSSRHLRTLDDRGGRANRISDFFKISEFLKFTSSAHKLKITDFENSEFPNFRFFEFSNFLKLTSSAFSPQFLDFLNFLELWIFVFFELRKFASSAHSTKYKNCKFFEFWNLEAFHPQSIISSSASTGLVHLPSRHHSSVHASKSSAASLLSTPFVTKGGTTSSSTPTVTQSAQFTQCTPNTYSAVRSIRPRQAIVSPDILRRYDPHQRFIARTKRSTSCSSSDASDDDDGRRLTMLSTKCTPKFEGKRKDDDDETDGGVAGKKGGGVGGGGDTGATGNGSGSQGGERSAVVGQMQSQEKRWERVYHSGLTFTFSRPLHQAFLGQLYYGGLIFSTSTLNDGVLLLPLRPIPEMTLLDDQTLHSPADSISIKNRILHTSLSTQTMIRKWTEMDSWYGTPPREYYDARKKLIKERPDTPKSLLKVKKKISKKPKKEQNHNEFPQVLGAHTHNGWATEDAPMNWVQGKDAGMGHIRGIWGTPPPQSISSPGLLALDEMK
ncbi:Protein CBG11877 [Caenorhabditis briggsae]|uniref:Protein CBG11877 n=1 Tax=Caenorhabditis briggsae TaxID=6238 RepID=A8XE76_CAEBR|nr:Protein CBG11877 [Caenorhabditis briggsae]CAP30948.1 Protein CBG11877 [Caenorhabditis briggsae]